VIACERALSAVWTRPLFARTRFAYIESAAVQFLAMERLDGSLRAFLGFHSDKGKPARLAAEFVHDQIDTDHGAVRGEKVLEIVFGGVEGEVSYKQFRVHDDFLSLD